MSSSSQVAGFTANLLLVVVFLARYPESTSSEHGCDFGWEKTSTYCYKVFDTSKETFRFASLECHSQKATLFSKTEAQDVQFTSKTFWVDGTRNVAGFCAAYKPKDKRVIDLACTEKRAYICKKPFVPEETDVGIEYFGVVDGDSITQGKKYTLQCRLSGWSQVKTTIAIGHGLADGSLAVLSKGDYPKLEYEGEMRCEDTGEYLCEVKIATETHRKSVVVAAKKCPPVWCSSSEGRQDTRHHRMEIKLGESMSLDACFLSAYDLTGDAGAVVWYRNNELYSGLDKPQAIITKDGKEKLKYKLSVQVSVDSPNLYGMWSLKLSPFYDGSRHASEPFHLTVDWSGPPIFCPDQVTMETVYLEIGETYDTSVCFLSPLEPSSVNAHAPKFLGTGFRPNPNFPSVGHFLEISVAPLTADDIGNWRFVIPVDKFSLTYNLQIRAKGPPVWCSSSEGRQDTRHHRMEIKLGESMSLDACFLSAYDLTADAGAIVWYKNNELYSGLDKPQAIITKDGKEKLKYRLSVQVSVDSPNLYGMWSLKLSPFYDGSRHASEPFHLTVDWSGPPIFCPDQVTMETVYLEIGETYATSVCFLSPLNPSSVNAHAPNSVGTGFRPNPNFPSVGHFLEISVAPLTADDIGNWRFVIPVDKFSLTYNLQIRAKGPPVWCSSSEGRQDTRHHRMEIKLGESMSLDACFLSAYDLTADAGAIVWYKNNELYSGLDKPQAIITKDGKEKLKYRLSVQVSVDSPNLYGMWSLKLSPFYDGSRHASEPFHLTVDWSGSPQCPPEVNVTAQTSSSVTLTWFPGHSGSAEQTFFVFYDVVNNGSAVTREWHRRHFPTSNNSRVVSGTVSGLLANTTFLFRVAAVNKFNLDTVTSSTCDAITVEATTDILESDDTKGTNPERIKNASKGGWFEFPMLYIVIGASCLACVIIIAVGTAVLIRRKRAASKRKNRKLLDNTSTSPTDDGNIYANAKAFSGATEEEEENKMRQWLIHNPAYQTSHGASPDFSINDSGRHVTDEGLVYLKVDHSATGGGGAGADPSVTPTLKTFAPSQRVQFSEDRTHYANIDFFQTGNRPTPETEYKTKF